MGLQISWRKIAISQVTGGVYRSGRGLRYALITPTMLALETRVANFNNGLLK